MRDRRTQLVELLADAIEGGASVNYVLPFQREDLRTYWEGVTSDVRRGARVVLAIIDEDRVMGSVQSCPAASQINRIVRTWRSCSCTAHTASEARAWR